MSDVNARLRALPQIDRVIDALEGHGPRDLVAQAARRAVDGFRAEIHKGAAAPELDDIVARARTLLEEESRDLLRPVINATGVLIHTNLGRAPLGEAQLEAVRTIAGGYSNLEYDIGRGNRGDRYSHASKLLCALTGAEAALVVNNNAAAVLLTLAALCADREVIISRGELIEIGGEFRIPEVMAISRTLLVEVGTTNRTHLADYERAISDRTAAILKVHPSNYRVVGFTATVGARDLARLARGRGVTFIHDLGSGYVRPRTSDVPWASDEPPVDLALQDGADVVTFSGDKLLGGPQAGVIAGRAALVERISSHALLRALRVDKMTLAALEATVAAHLEGRFAELPLWRMALAPEEGLKARAESLARSLSEADPAIKAEAQPSRSVTGGGSLPGEEMSSWAVAVTHPERSAAAIERALRHGTVPVIGRVVDDRVLLDLRTVAPELDERLLALVLAALR